jgi:uncharacterized protein YhfF
MSMPTLARLRTMLTAAFLILAVGWHDAVPATDAAEDTAASGERVSAFVAEARKATGLPLEHYSVRLIGSTERASEAIIPLVVARLKTGTFSLLAEYEESGTPLPRPGDLFVVTHFDGRPAFLYRVLEVELVPFGDIGQRHLDVEGPTLREREAWRTVHLRAWEALLERMQRKPSEEMPVVWQRFEVLHPPNAP